MNYEYSDETMWPRFRTRNRTRTWVSEEWTLLQGSCEKAGIRAWHCSVCVLSGGTSLHRIAAFFWSADAVIKPETDVLNTAWARWGTMRNTRSHIFPNRHTPIHAGKPRQSPPVLQNVWMFINNTWSTWDLPHFHHAFICFDCAIHAQSIMMVCCT